MNRSYTFTSDVVNANCSDAASKGRSAYAPQDYFFGALLSAGVMLPSDALLEAAGVLVDAAGVLFEAAGILVDAAGVLFDAAGELFVGALFEAGGVTLDLIGADVDVKADNVSWVLIRFDKTVYKSTNAINEMPRMRDAFDIISSNVALPL